MRSLTSRADLIRAARLLGHAGLVEAARGLGYEVNAVEEDVRDGGASGAGRTAPPGPPPAPLQTEPSVPFWQPLSIDIVDEEGERALIREVEAREVAAEEGRAWASGDAEAPRTEPLSPWSRTGPQLQRALSTGLPGRRLDVRRLVRRWCRGEHVSRLPRCERRGWRPVVVLVDRSLRMVPFWDDQDQVVIELRRVLGKQGVIAKALPDGPDDVEATMRRCRVPASGEMPVLALSDLGWYGGEDAAEAWIRFGRELRRVGQRVHALVPVPCGRWTDEGARVWRAMPWERPAPGSQVALEPGVREARVGRLLRLLGPAMRIEPGLIRAIRMVLPREEADAGTEADVWARPELGEQFPDFRAFSGDRADEFRRAFLGVESDQQRAVMAALRSWHWNEGRKPEAWYLEVLALARARAVLNKQPGMADASRLPLDSAEDELRRAEAFMALLAGDVRSRGAGRLSEERKSSLRTWCRFVTEQQRALPGSATPAGDALQLIGLTVGGVEIPNLNPRLLDLVRPPPPRVPQEYRLHQVGCGLVVTPDSENGSPIAALVARDPRLYLTGHKSPVRLDEPGGRVEVHPRGEVELRTDRTTLRMGRLVRPAWAREVGRDEFGLWAELVVAGVAFRMRWIPPGRFVMGSPAGEPGRFDDREGPQHLVTISRGFWLGETPVTQALWEAVVGENPSEFRTPDRPVEQVSWDDCQEKLIARLNEGRPVGERFRLPTEAEWEYACRAGTTTATYAGPIEILGVNNAPVLDAIAWYGGISGKDFDLEDGEDSSGWEEKQHAHTRAGTRRTGEKQPNQWGLHDMLGNVWEWCSDHASWPMQGYSSAAQRDPVGPDTGVLRVIRGGSWSAHARDVRAACRDAFQPGLRYSNLGLRLARDQAQPEGPEDPQPEAGREDG